VVELFRLCYVLFVLPLFLFDSAFLFLLTFVIIAIEFDWALVAIE